METILAVDPGTTKSAYCMMTDAYEIISAADVDNETVLKLVKRGTYDTLVIECMQARTLNIKTVPGKPAPPQRIGAETYDTCIWIGRFLQTALTRHKNVHRIYRSEERSAIIPSKKNKLPPLPETAGRSNDSKIRSALIARFAKHDMRNGKGTAKNKDVFYGFQGDMWAAFAVGVTYLDKHRRGGA